MRTLRHALMVIVPFFVLMGCTSKTPEKSGNASAEPAKKSIELTKKFTISADAAKGWPMSVAFSPDGQTIAVGMAATGELVVAETGSGKEIKRLKAHDPGVTAVVFTDGGKKIITSGIDAKIRIWDTATWKEHAKFDSGGVLRLAVTPDGKTLASTDFSTIQLWDLENGKPKSKLEGHQGLITAIAFTPDSKTLASGAENDASKPGEIKLWDVETAKEKPPLKFATPLIGVKSLAFSADGKTLASIGNGVRLWDVDSASEKSILEKAGKADQEALAFRSDNQTLAVGRKQGGVISFFDISSAKEESVPQGTRGRVACMAFSPDGSLLAAGNGDSTGSGDNTLIVWSVSKK